MATRKRKEVEPAKPKPHCTVCHGRGYIEAERYRNYEGRVVIVNKGCSCIEEQVRSKKP